MNIILCVIIIVFFIVLFCMLLILFVCKNNKTKGGKLKIDESDETKNFVKELFIMSHYKVRSGMFINKIQNDKQIKEFIKSKDITLNINKININECDEELRNMIPKKDIYDIPFNIKNVYKITNSKFDNEYIKGKKFIYGFHETYASNILSILYNGFDTKFIGTTTDFGWYGKGAYFEPIFTTYWYYGKNKYISYKIVCKIYYKKYCLQSLPLEPLTDKLEQDICNQYSEQIKNKLTISRGTFTTSNIGYFNEKTLKDFMCEDWFDGKITDSLYYPKEKIDMLVVVNQTGKNRRKIDNFELTDNADENGKLLNIINFLTSLNEGNEENTEDNYSELFSDKIYSESTILFNNYRELKDIKQYKEHVKRLLIVSVYSFLLYIHIIYCNKNDENFVINEIIDQLNKNDFGEKIPERFEKNISDDIISYIKTVMKKYEDNYFELLKENINEINNEGYIFYNKRTYKDNCYLKYSCLIRDPITYVNKGIGLYILFGEEGSYLFVHSKKLKPGELIVSDTKLIDIAYILEYEIDYDNLEKVCKHIYDTPINDKYSDEYRINRKFEKYMNGIIKKYNYKK